VGCVVVVVETFFLDRERGASLSLSLSLLFSSDGNVVADVFAVVVVVMVVGLLLFPKIHFFDEKFATEIKHQSHDNDRRERAKGWRATSERRRRRRETTAPSSEEQQNQQQQQHE